uniref:Brain-enriched guanylate kinase-associated protein n=1 Tax=Astyanax mexicanus TaxID=7994 RepID=W5LLZ5_ASTMX
MRTRKYQTRCHLNKQTCLSFCLHSYMQEQKENLRKNLSHTTHKLKMLESEFDTTRQYLEKELRQTQEKLDKFIDELIQSSYAALQRINHDLQDKIHKKTQLFEEEKRALSQEIIVLNNHLMEAKLTIEKLRKDNDLYRKDCHLAAQLLRCGKSQHRAHKVPEQPTDFQRGTSPQIKKHGHPRRTGLGLTPYSDTVPTAINAKILEKPEAGSSFSITAEELLTNNGGDTGDALHRSVAYKSSDLYCSDTALYCPVMERQYWKRPRSVDLLGRDTNQGLLQAENSTESIPDVNTFQPSFSNSELPLYEFPMGSPPPPSSYSNFSVASDEKSHTPSSSLSSSQLALYMDWQVGDYEQKNTPAYDKNSTGFPMLHSLQHMSPSLQKANTPVYMRTASYGEPYQQPQLTSSHSKGSTSVPRETHMHIAEDINTRPYHSPGRVSPYSFFQQRFDAGPADKKLGNLHSSFQGGDNIFHTHTHTHNTAKKVKKEYRDISPNSSEPLHQNSPEASKVQHYLPHSPDPQKKTPPHNQTFRSIGLSRKDSLSKAQLYGTLLN